MPPAVDWSFNIFCAWLWSLSMASVSCLLPLALGPGLMVLLPLLDEAGGADCATFTWPTCSSAHSGTLGGWIVGRPMAWRTVMVMLIGSPTSALLRSKVVMTSMAWAREGARA